jgi:hypothetical protein
LQKKISALRRALRNLQQLRLFLRQGDETETGSYAMMKRMLKPMLAFGLASALALSAVTPSLGQTQQRQRPAAQDQGIGAPQDETFGQTSPRGQSRAPAGAQQSGQCWIPTNEDQGMGYYGECSAKGARQYK